MRSWVSGATSQAARRRVPAVCLGWYYAYGIRSRYRAAAGQDTSSGSPHPYTWYDELCALL